MCGVAGLLDFRRETPDEELRAIACRMASTLLHRGPDDAGVWVDAAAGIALAHRRLSILDLSPAGHQPMESPSGRYVIVFNGEIYNFPELRDQLKEEAGGCLRLRGHSDTEVLLLAIEHWGLKPAIDRVNGMFAFGLWDRRERTLHLGRDRMGEKPLYYGWAGKTLLFGSELKSLRAYPGWDGEIDRDAWTLFMRHNAIPAPYTIYRGVRKLPPASSLTFRSPLGEADRNAVPKAYWDFPAVVREGQQQL